MKTIKLYGQLGKRFGKEFKLSVTSAAEAIRALNRVVNGFSKYLSNEAKSVQYAIFVNDEQLLHAELAHPISDSDVIRIVPMVHGSGDLFRIVLGVALVFLIAPMLPTAPLFGIQGLTAAGIATSIGTSLILGGLGSMLFGSTAPETIETYEETENKPSYSFSGPVNTVSQGNPIPIGYGQLLIGSQVISAGIKARNIAV